MCVNMPASWKMGFKIPSIFVPVHEGWTIKRIGIGSLEEGYKMKSLAPPHCFPMVGWERKKEVMFIKQQMQARSFVYSIKS